MFFSFFFFVFFFFFFFLFFSLGFRASGITCIWFSIEKMFLEVNFFLIFFSFVFLFFLFFSFFCSFLTKKCKNMKNNENMSLFFKKKRKSYTCCKGVPGAMCCGKLYNSLRFGGILDPRVLCGQLRAFISISALTHVVFSQWSFGPYGQVSSRSRPNDGRNESFPCVHVWSGLCLLVTLVPTRAEWC